MSSLPNVNIDREKFCKMSRSIRIRGCDSCILVIISVVIKYNVNMIIYL